MSKNVLSKLLLLFSITLLFVSCATVEYIAPPVPEPGKALIIFYRERDAMPGSFYSLKIDDKYYGRFSINTYFSYQATPGTHSLKAGGGFQYKEKQITVEEGKTYYVNLDVKVHILIVDWKLMIVDPMEGREIVQKLSRREDLRVKD
jgi:hypothetical protein